MKRFLLPALAAGLFSFAQPCAAADRPLAHATFVQYQTWIAKLKETDWEAELRAMQEAGIDTVVLQWLKYDQHDYLAGAGGADPTEKILAYADQHQMKIYLGTWFFTEWWKRGRDREFLHSTATKVTDFAKTVWARYQRHPSWVGWYIPFEIGDNDYRPEEIADVAAFLANLTGTTKKIATRPMTVASSVFFSQKIPVATAEQNLAQLFSKSGVDIIIVQDGMGERDWSAAQRAKAEEYLTALVRAAKKTGARAWVAVEVFKAERDATGKTKRVPGQISEILPRLAREKKLADDVIFFDFFHYMSPFRGTEQKALFGAYK